MDLKCSKLKNKYNQLYLIKKEAGGCIGNIVNKRGAMHTIKRPIILF
jgi:hypothetical protein